MHLRAVLRTPGVLGPFAAKLVGRLPLGALGLVFVLHVQELTGSFALAGLASGAYALGLGASAPLLGRLVDARGLRAVLPSCAAASAVALVAAALLPGGAPPAALVALAAATGLTMPPLGASLRALWVEALPDPDRQHAAFALDSGAGEILYVIGPVGIAGGIGAWSARAALVVCAACIVAGAVAFSAQAGTGRRPGAARAGGRAGALASPAVRGLVGVFCLLGVAFGGIEVGVVAAADAADARGLAGPLLGLWGVGW
jgi:MFS family permease